MIVARIASRSLFVASLVVATLVALLPGQSGAQSASGQKITGSGVVKEETRTVSGFHGIALGVHAHVELRQGDSEGLSIRGDDNIVPLVETVVKDGTLMIRWAHKENYSATYKTLEIVVNAKTIDALAVQGSGEIHAERLKAGRLHTAIEGSGEIAVDTLNADSVDAAVNGSGRLRAAGRADLLDVALSGSGEISAGKLESSRARIVLQGSAQAVVWAKQELNATIAGSGQIEYYGTPQLKQTIAGSGRIKRVPDAS